MTGRSVSFGPKLRTALNNLVGGGAASVLTVTFGLSYSLLIFAGPLAPYLSYGVAVTFISTAVLAAVIALGSSLPFAIAGPESSTAAVTAILASSLVERTAVADTAAPQLAPVLITLGLSTIVTGIVLCGFGVTRMGRAIRYVPYPVVGGFLGAIGCLLSAYSFAQIKRSAQERGIRLVLVHLPPAAEKALRSSEFISKEVSIIAELDHALEWCENEIIARHHGLEQKEASLRDWFTQILGTDHDAARLIHRCQRIEVEAGETIVSAGEAADSMHFILDGRVGIMIPAEEGRTTRVRSLGRYTTIGEMGLVSHAPRSATIQAEVASILYVLSADQFEAIKAEDPALSHKLLTYFVSVMAERLTFANRMIAVLRR